MKMNSQTPQPYVGKLRARLAHLLAPSRTFQLNQDSVQSVYRKKKCFSKKIRNFQNFEKSLETSLDIIEMYLHAKFEPPRSKTLASRTQKPPTPLLHIVFIRPLRHFTIRSCHIPSVMLELKYKLFLPRDSPRQKLVGAQPPQRGVGQPITTSSYPLLIYFIHFLFLSLF